MSFLRNQLQPPHGQRANRYRIKAEHHAEAFFGSFDYSGLFSQCHGHMLGFSMFRAFRHYNKCLLHKETIRSLALGPDKKLPSLFFILSPGLYTGIPFDAY